MEKLRKRSLHHTRRRSDTVHKLGNRVLIQALTESEISGIQKYFMRSDTGTLNQEQLRKAILEVAHLKFDEGQFELIFLRINISRNGFVSWDEFISHLILGFKVKEVSNEPKSLDEPIAKKARVVRSNHRHPINCITFNFQVKPDRSCNYADGSYITGSKDGCINYWSLDFQVERTVYSKSPHLKVCDTWVLCVACLPDVSIICTSSTERDIRFYDTSARKFELRVHFQMMDYAVTCMDYVFSQDLNEECKLIMGDMGGNVRVLFFSPIDRGPFRSKLDFPLLNVHYSKLLLGEEPGFRIYEFKRIHNDWVRQVQYYNTMNFIISCSCSNRAVVMRDVNENRGVFTYYIQKGCWCFTTADGFPLFATGGPDCCVRVWNPYLTKRPLVTFYGHHTGIVAMIMQDKGEILCSISEDRCIKIWDVPNQECIQTFLGIGPEVASLTGITLFYNPESRQLIIGGLMIAILPLRPLQNSEHTDGITHQSAISVVLYNPLFRRILTCGLDSFIIVWDPWNGKRLSVVRNAHTINMHGEITPVEITAATFDPGNQLLLTGAHDGSLKTWNFNTGTCLRNMRIESGCEVTGVCWFNGRIMAIGWNRHVTEFDDSGKAAAPGGAFSKDWATRHTDDVLCAASRIPQTLATSSYGGELVLWTLETGQPYKQYIVNEPTKRIKIQYDFQKDNDKKIKMNEFKRKLIDKKKMYSMSRLALKRISTFRSDRRATKTSTVDDFSRYRYVGRKITNVAAPPTQVHPIRSVAVRAMLFLDCRPMQPGVANLLIALENGQIQSWSDHSAGGFLGSFDAQHRIGEYIVTMATDKNNEYLFTGSTMGYIKTFLIKNLFSGTEEHISMPYYRLKFPFLWKRMFWGRAAFATKDQLVPKLLNSFMGHRGIISQLVYIDKTEIVVSASSDFSVRLWSLGGKYLGLLGTFKPWIEIDPDQPIRKDYPLSIPPDVRRSMSSTTCRVLMGERYVKRLTKKQLQAQAEKDMTFKSSVTYGQKLVKPILGHYVHLPEKTTASYEVSLDTSLPYIPVYQHILRPPPKILPNITPPSFLPNPKYRLSRGKLEKQVAGLELV